MRNRRLFQILWSVLWVSQVGSAAQQLSNTPRQDFWVTDGAVNAIAVTNDRVFIGGSFRYVGPYTGGGVPVNVNTMQPVAKYPKVNGSVLAVEPDGLGGWFIGGEFTTVGGRPRTNLAHITATGEVNTNWVAQATGSERRGRVEKLMLDGATLYVAGYFTNLGGLPRNSVGALEAASGVVRPWAPQADSNVLALAMSPTAIYLGGKFLTLNGQERRYVGAVDKVTGQTTSWNPWNPAINPIMYYGFVTNAYPLALTVINGLVIVPGAFRTGFAYVNLAGFRETDSARILGVGGAQIVLDLKSRGNKIYVAGQFSEIGGDGVFGGVPRRNLAVLDLANGGRVSDWNPTAQGNGYVQTLCFRGESVIAAGVLTAPNPSSYEGTRTNADNIVRLDLATGSVVGELRPFNNGAIYAVATQGDQVFLGGLFDSMGGIPQDFLAELSLRDGSLQSWNPRPNSVVTALAFAQGWLLLGGAFYEMDGIPRSCLAACELATGQLSEWNPQVQRNASAIESPISDILPLAGSVFVAGEFNGVGGQSRSNLCKIDLTSGQPDPWRADSNGRVDTIEYAGGFFYVGGRFTKLGGVDRAYLGRLDVNSAAVDGWAPQPDLWIDSLSANSSAIYASGWFTNISGVARRGTAAFAVQSGTLLPWNLDSYVSQIFGPVGSPLLATDEAIYAVGFFFPDADYRLVIGVDPETAGLGSWDPRPNNLYYSVPLVSDGQRLFVGGEHYAVVAPSGRAIAVFEREGFSRFTQIDLGPPLTKLSLSVDQGRQVIVERTTDFSTWTGVSTNMAWEGLVELLDPRPPSTLPAFYRAGTNQPQ